MWTRVLGVLACLVVGLGIAVMPADAAEGRVGIFTVPCDGTNKHVEFNASSLGNSVTRLIQGVEILAVDTRGGLLYVVARAANDEKKQLRMLGPGSTHSRGDFTGFLQVSTSPTGDVVIGTEVGCALGAPLPVVVTVYFFS